MGETVKYVNEQNQSAVATTCNDYIKLNKEKYFTADNYNTAMESYFVTKCNALIVLENAQPANTSFVRNFNLQKDYGLLPAALIFPDLSGEEQQNGSLHELYSDIQIEKNQSDDKYSITLSSEKAAATTVISILAWGDFSHSGLDEMLILVAVYAYHFEGSYRSYNTYILTRKSANAPLEEVKTPELND